MKKTSFVLCFLFIIIILGCSSSTNIKSQNTVAEKPIVKTDSVSQTESKKIQETPTQNESVQMRILSDNEYTYIPFNDMIFFLSETKKIGDFSSTIYESIFKSYVVVKGLQNNKLFVWCSADDSGNGTLADFDIYDRNSGYYVINLINNNNLPTIGNTILIYYHTRKLNNKNEIILDKFTEYDYPAFPNNYKNVHLVKIEKNEQTGNPPYQKWIFSISVKSGIIIGFSPTGKLVIDTENKRIDDPNEYDIIWDNKEGNDHIKKLLNKDISDDERRDIYFNKRPKFHYFDLYSLFGVNTSEYSPSLRYAFENNKAVFYPRENFGVISYYNYNRTRKFQGKEYNLMSLGGAIESSLKYYDPKKDNIFYYETSVIGIVEENNNFKILGDAQGVLDKYYEKYFVTIPLIMQYNPAIKSMPNMCVIQYSINRNQEKPIFYIENIIRF